MQRGGTKFPTFATATQLIVAGVGVAAKFSRYAGVRGCSNARERKREGMGKRERERAVTQRTRERETEEERERKRERERERERGSRVSMSSPARG